MGLYDVVQRKVFTSGGCAKDKTGTASVQAKDLSFAGAHLRRLLKYWHTFRFVLKLIATQGSLERFTTLEGRLNKGKRVNH